MSRANVELVRRFYEAGLVLSADTAQRKLRLKLLDIDVQLADMDLRDIEEDGPAPSLAGAPSPFHRSGLPQTCSCFRPPRNSFDRPPSSDPPASASNVSAVFARYPHGSVAIRSTR
jgi:hypothetical protein